MSTTQRSFKMNEKQRQKDSESVEITVPRKHLEIKSVHCYFIFWGKKSVLFIRDTPCLKPLNSSKR